ncbi:MAG: hypothetical protein IMZ46_04165 [Acidobacteria bacterium]|nr:hypothetical protein [Acidobacteriota bacterium]
MNNILVPKNHFLDDSGHYPDMEDYILGLPIPIGWGDIHEVVPFCVDTDDLRFKLVDQHIQDITEIRSKGIVLSAGSYTEDLAVAEFILKGTPFLTHGNYYFAISADYAINGADYLKLITMTLNPAGNQAYEIDGANLWTPIAGKQLFFYIYGKQTLDGPEEWIHHVIGVPISAVYLRDAAARTRIGEAFHLDAPFPSLGYYITKIRVYFNLPAGVPVGSLIATIFSGINPDVQVGIQGNAIEVIAGQTIYDLTFPQEGEDSDLVADIESPYPMLTNGADILEDLFISVLDKNPVPALLEPTSLADFAAKRTQELKIFIDREMTVGDFIGKLEASLLWKFLPLQDGTYGTIVFEPGEPAGTPHFKDIDFVEGTEFRVEHDLSVVRNVVRVKYDENPATQEFRVQEARSDFARLFYSNEDTVEVETWLKQDADAADLAEDYSLLFQKVPVRIVFEVHGAGLTLLPGRDKVKITRARAAWPGGSINGELFRIMKIVKKPATNTAEITAVFEVDTSLHLGIIDPGLSPTSTMRIKTHLSADSLEHISHFHLPLGTGDDECSSPFGICSDGEYYYITDVGNHRIKKHRISDGAFIWDIGGPASGIGDDEFNVPWGICTDGTYLYITDNENNRIKKHLCSTGAYVAKVGSYGAGPNQFLDPFAICTDGVHLYITQNGGWAGRLEKYTCALVYVGQMDDDGHIDGSTLSGICTDGTFLFIATAPVPPTNCIYKYTLALAWVSDYGASGAGDTNFENPNGICTDGIHLYIADTDNNRVKKHRVSDFAYVSKIGSLGNADNEFVTPLGICLTEPYSK